MWYCVFGWVVLRVFQRIVVPSSPGFKQFKKNYSWTCKMTVLCPRRHESSGTWQCNELEQWTGRDVKGSVHYLIWGTVPSFTGGSRKPQKPLLRWLICRLRFEPETYIWIRCSNHWTVVVGCILKNFKNLCALMQCSAQMNTGRCHFTPGLHSWKMLYKSNAKFPF